MMANFINTSLNDVHQVVVVPPEEAAAVAHNFPQQQPPPQQHVVHKTTYQPQQLVFVTKQQAVEGKLNNSVSTAPSTIQIQSGQQELPPLILNAQQLQQIMGKSILIRTMPPSHQVTLQTKPANQVQMQSIAVQQTTTNQPVVSSPQVMTTLQANSQTVIQRTPLQTPPRLSQQSQVLHLKAQTPPLLQTTPSPQRPTLMSIRGASGQLSQQQLLQSQIQVAKSPRTGALRKPKNSPKSPQCVTLKQSDQSVMNQQTISPMTAVQSVQTVQSPRQVLSAQSTQSVQQVLPAQPVREAYQIHQGQGQRVQNAQISDHNPMNHQNGSVALETEEVKAAPTERDGTKVASPRLVTAPVMKTQIITSRKEETKMIVKSPQTVVRSKVGQKQNQNSPHMRSQVQYVLKQAVANQVSVPQQNSAQVQSLQPHVRYVQINNQLVQLLQQNPQGLIPGQQQQTVQFQVPHDIQMQVQPHILQVQTNNVQQQLQQIQLPQPDAQQLEVDAHAQQLNQLPSQQQPIQIQIQQQQIQVQQQRRQPHLVQIQSQQHQVQRPPQQVQLQLQQQQVQLQPQQQQVQVQTQHQQQQVQVQAQQQQKIVRLQAQQQQQVHVQAQHQQQQVQVQAQQQQKQVQVQAQQQQQQIQVQAQQQQKLVQVQAQQQQKQVQVQAQQQQQVQVQAQQQQVQVQAQQQQKQVQVQAQQQQQQIQVQARQQQVQVQAQQQQVNVQAQQQHDQQVEVQLQSQKQAQHQQIQQQPSQQLAQVLKAQQQLVQLRTQQGQPTQQVLQKVQQPVQSSNGPTKPGVQQHTLPLLSQSLPQSTLNRTTVNGQSTTVVLSQNAVKVRPVSGPLKPSSQSKSRLPNTYSGPRQKRPTDIQIISRVAPASQQIASPLSTNEFQSLVKQFDGRIVHYTEGGTEKFLFQKLPQVPQVQLTQETSTVPEEEQITVYDGVNVEDAFPTGVPQECVVSESGELLFADNTNVKVEPIMDSSDVNIEPSNIDATENSMFEESSETVCVSSSSSISKNIEPEQLKLVPGKLAVCVYCGNLSIILNKCTRCQRSLPDTVKIVADASAKKMQAASPAPIIASVLVRRSLPIPEKISGKPVGRSLQSLQPLQNLPSLDIKRKRCSTPRRPRVKVPEEPEILTLSSDDEDKQEVKPDKKLDRESQLLANGSFSSVGSEFGTEEAAAMDEGDNAEEARQNSGGVQGGGLFEQAVEGSISSPFILIVCRTIRIGTFRAKPSERVVISSQGLEIKAPLPAGPEITVNVPMNYVDRVLVSFCRSMPVLFFYLNKDGGILVRQILNMKDPKPFYYFDPQSSDDTQKRITLLPEKITEDQKLALKRIFDGNKVVLCEIDNNLANDILVKSSSTDVRLRLTLPGNDIQTIMVYPPPPAKGGISINTEDYACLGEDQFLNDVIIDFYLKYLMQSVLSDIDRERTHVFSTFFYKRLTCKPKKGRRHPVEDDPNLTPAQKRHARVKGWTKSVNLFSKDFIIIPINENCHWFLAIICYPGQNGCLRMSDNTPIDVQKPHPTTVAAAVAAAAAAATTHSKLKVKDNVMSIGSTTITPVKATPAATITLDHNGEEGSDRDEAEGDEEEMDENSDDEDSGHTAEESNGSKDLGASVEGTDVPVPTSATMPIVNTNPLTKKGKAVVREGIKQPCILIFDSLVGAPRYRVAATLREYLSIEYKVKEKKDKEFSKDTIKGMLPKVPQQTNFTDCGLYLLQYAEMFFKDPIRDYHAPIKQLLHWFPEEVVSRKREDIVNLIKDLMKEQDIDPNTIKLPQLTFNNSSTHSKSQQLAEDEEAQARLAAADSEADAQVNQTSVVTPMEEDMSCESEVTVPHSTTEENSSSKSENVECGAINNGKSTEQHSSPRVNQSLVDYSESSNDSSSDTSLIKRSQSEVDSEDVIERKKRKAE